jgi:hypothetical protein
MELERNDVIATKDGKTLRVLSIYKTGNDITRVEGIDDASDSPCRRTVYVNNIQRILRKAKKEEVAK